MLHDVRSNAADLLLAPGAEPLPGYRLLQWLGGGGFGDVWKAEAPGGVQVALKFVSLRAAQGAVELRAFDTISGDLLPAPRRSLAVRREDRGDHLRPSPPAPDLTMLPEPERLAVARALAKEPNERWPNCRAFVEAIRSSHPEPVSAAIPPVPSSEPEETASTWERPQPESRRSTPTVRPTSPTQPHTPTEDFPGGVTDE
jgi:hypothetical protein